MKKTFLCFGAICLAALVFSAQARVITVTTANNINPPAGQTSLAQAIAALQDGDQIQFNIPGDGPHVILTPVGGYPLITKNNITIDGYSQPGSAPNSNAILGGNNAQIKIVLDSSSDASSGDPALPDRCSTRLPYPGYGDSENGIIAVYEGDNFTIRGISFLARQTDCSDADPKIYCVALVKEALNAKLQGCWFGLSPDGTTVKGCGSAVAAFRHRVNEGGVNVDTFSGGLVFGTDGDGVNDVAEFNISVGMHIALALEAPDVRVAGNYFNVFADGKTFYDVEALYAEMLALGLDVGDASVETFENGRKADNTIIGTNGDGISDANERNIFGHSIYDHDIEFYSQAVNVVVAGNYFGVGVDGSTTSPTIASAMPDCISMPGTGSIRVGSNGDGKSDDLEGNLIVNIPGARFVQGGNSVPIVARRNKMVNNAFSGFPFSDGQDGRNYGDYYADALVDAVNGAIPLITDVTDGVVSGTLPAPNTANYPNHVVDIYVVDKAALDNNGLTLPGVYAGSFVEGSKADKDPAANAFKISLIGLPIPVGSQIALAVTYLKNPAGSGATDALTGPLSAGVEANIPPYAPGSIESVGLTRIVPDTPIINQGADALGNWEPYSSVLGNQVFLIEGNAFAEDGTMLNQRFVVMAQPVDGKAGKMLEGFYTDNGTPFPGQINLSRKDGNPGRVAGDKRPGAEVYMVGAEASPHGIAQFQSDNRWNLGVSRLDNARYGTVQNFKLDAATLTPTPLCKALDSANGRLTSGTPPDAQITRFGGEIAALSNGNFVSVVEDRSKLRNPNGNCVVATIFAPDGSVVKDSWLVANGDIWSNAAACKDGFVVRVAGILYIYDNDGNLLRTVSQDTSGESFDTERGDGTRIAGHINSPYVFLTGKVKTSNMVKLAAWDIRDGSFTAVADVSEAAFPGTPDRVNLAVDALNRAVVAWESQPDGYEAMQVAARVLVLDGTAKTIAPLTKSFLAFINAEKTGLIHTFRMTVSMTTKQIMVAAKGEINLSNRPANGADSPKELNFYTVFTHPDPKDDPTPPAGAVDKPTLTIAKQAANVVISWTPAGGTLESKSSLSEATWTVVGTQNPATVAIGAGAKFYRVRK